MSVIKVCPPPSELCVIKTNIHCPEEGCRSVFKNSGNLDMHLSKHHKRKDILKKEDEVRCQYHCPVDKCPYNLNSRQFFKRFKYLKQVSLDICIITLVIRVVIKTDYSQTKSCNATLLPRYWMFQSFVTDHL
jgi:hypothetical protein